MIVNCKDRSGMKLKRRRSINRHFTPKRGTTVTAFRSDESYDRPPSVLERRANKVWRTKEQDWDEQEAAKILAELINV